MKTNEALKNYLKPLITNLIEKFSPKSIFVYGSYASNEHTKESDIEIGLIKSETPVHFNTPCQ